MNRSAVAALAVAAVAVVILAYTLRSTGGQSDVDQLHFAARALLDGRNPYALIGPGLEFQWLWPLLYPLPSVVPFLALAWLPVEVARIAFLGTSAALLGYALARDEHRRWPVLLSFAWLHAAQTAQWTMLLTAAAMLGWSWLYPLKPTIGVPLLAAESNVSHWTRAAWATAVLGGIAVLLRPTWLMEWREAMLAGTHFRVPLTVLGGPLVLLALVRWRRPEAWLLVAFAATPHTPLWYEVLPLVLVTRSRLEAILFAFMTHAWLVLHTLILPRVDDPVTWATRIMVATVLLPLTWLVWRRPNEGPAPAFLRWAVQ